MKKWMAYMLIGVCAAGAAVAENNIPWWKKPFVKSADEETQVIPPAPAAPVLVAPEPEMPRAPRREGAAGERLMQINPQAVEKMKAQHEALMKLGEAARNEIDPVKKEVLVNELRAKLTEIADRTLAAQRKRLERAESELPKLRERLANAEKNKEARIEEQLQKILSGEPLKGAEGKRPGDGKQHKKGNKPPSPVTE